MPSVKQIIAEIQLAPDLPPSHIAKAVQIVRDAEARLALKLTRQPRKIANAKNLVTLEEWEKINGKLSIDCVLGMLRWCEREKFYAPTIIDLIEEFRTDMMSKNKMYGNFVMAFQTYLRKGYLSKKMDDCRNAQITVIHSKGVNL